MNVAPKTISIGKDRDYTFYHISARQLHKLKLKLVRLIGGAIAAAGGKIDQDFMDLDIGVILSNLITNLDDKTVDELHGVLFSQMEVKCVVDGEKVVEVKPVKENGQIDNVAWDIAFDINHLEHPELAMWEALKHYFGNFQLGKAGKLSDILSKAQKQMSRAFPVTSKTNGPFGG